MFLTGTMLLGLVYSCSGGIPFLLTLWHQTTLTVIADKPEHYCAAYLNHGVLH